MTKDNEKLEQMRSYARVAVMTKNKEQSEYEKQMEKINKIASSISSETKIDNRLHLHTNALNQKFSTAKKPLQSIASQTQSLTKTESEEATGVELNNLELNENLESSLAESLHQSDIDADVYIKPKKSFRFKVCVCAMLFAFATLSFWNISNQIKIENLSTEISSSQQVASEYEMNIKKYLLKIDSLDKATNGESPENSIIDEIITIQPLPLEDEVGFEKESNWFDSICNFLSNIFGG